MHISEELQCLEDNLYQRNVSSDDGLMMLISIVKSHFEPEAKLQKLVEATRYDKRGEIDAGK